MGGKSPDPPNYAPVAQASRESAEVAKELGNRQLDFTERQYEELKPLFERITGMQMQAAQQQMDMAQNVYEYQKMYRPVERELVRRAQEFNTEAYREGLARQAKADTERAFANQDQAHQRQMLSMGIDPSSGRFDASKRIQDTQQAALQANAMNQTRQQARDKGNALLAGAAGLGRGMSPALAAYSGAMNAGNSAGQNAMAPGNQYMAGLQAGAGTIQSGQALQMRGLGSILNTQGSIYQADQQANAALWQGIGGAAGTAFGLTDGFGMFT